jgi:PAS domain S-box-containing protein
MVDNLVKNLSAAWRDDAQTSEAWLQLIIKSLSVSVSYVDRDQLHTFVNRAYTEQFHLDRAAIIGRTAREALGEENYRAVRPRLEAALRAKSNTTSATFVCLARESRVTAK